MTYGIIGGSGFYEFAGLESAAEREVETDFGAVSITEGELAGRRVLYASRHGRGHRRLSSQVNHRGNILALKEMGADALVATTVVGIVDPERSLGRLIVFDDLYFPDNRLPDGEACTFFTEPGGRGRGHLIESSPFSASLRSAAIRAATASGIAFDDGGTYAHANGPRFNTKAEIAALRAAGAAAVSQTAGPEAVLAGELELPFQLLGFGVDYANGARPEPTPVETLNANMKASVDVFRTVIGRLVEADLRAAFDSGFVYRFE
jgi:5'-methylthioadenosine phosphorylase